MNIGGIHHTTTYSNLFILAFHRQQCMVDCSVDGCENERVVDWSTCWDCFVEQTNNIDFNKSIDDAKEDVNEFFDG